jgi:hypothetical protein
MIICHTLLLEFGGVQFCHVKTLCCNQRILWGMTGLVFSVCWILPVKFAREF